VFSVALACSIHNQQQEILASSTTAAWRSPHSSNFKSKVGSILSKDTVLHITLNIDDTPVASKSHMHFLSQNCCRLLSLCKNNPRRGVHTSRHDQITDHRDTHRTVKKGSCMCLVSISPTHQLMIIFFLIKVYVLFAWFTLLKKEEFLSFF
jgi:hypothetical protein